MPFVKRRDCTKIEVRRGRDYAPQHKLTFDVDNEDSMEIMAGVYHVEKQVKVTII